MPALTDNMTFGIFLAPFHRVGENPTLALERDLELLEWLDALGYDEAWIGEHHSGGWETIASPEVFIATAAGRTSRLRLGTGVVSLPYHNPYMVANRMVLLDHLTRGRVMLGVGPGSLASDAYMFCIDPERQREMMDESLGVIIKLFEGEEPVTCETDWFQLREASLQLRPFQKPYLPVAVASVQSPAGVFVAGKHGADVLSLSVPRSMIRQTTLKDQWDIAEESAREHGKEVRRSGWRLSVPVHLAATREEAFEQVRVGAGTGGNRVHRRHQRPPHPRRTPGRNCGLHGGRRSVDRRHPRRRYRSNRTLPGIQRRLWRSAGAGRGLDHPGEPVPQLRTVRPLRHAPLPGQPGGHRGIQHPLLCHARVPAGQPPRRPPKGYRHLPGQGAVGGCASVV